MTPYAYAKVSKVRNGPRKAGAARPARRLWHVSPEGFGELRRSCLLSRKAAAAFLGVSLRTVAYWEAGRCRVPWSVVRLLRILRLGDLGALSRDWSGWSLHGGMLHSPEGRAFTPQGSAWWALLVAQARAFMDGRARLGGVGAAAPARPQAVAPQPEAGEAAALDADAAGHGAGGFPLNALEGVPVYGAQPVAQRGGARARRARAPLAGLVSLSTSGTRIHETQQACGFQPVVPASKWCHYGVTLTLPESCHDRARPLYPAVAPGPCPAGRSHGPALGPELERPVCDGPAQLRELPVPDLSAASCGPRPPSGPDCSGSGAVRSSSGGGARRGPECALPVRQRQEIQALPWGGGALSEGGKGAAPGEFGDRPGAAFASTTGSVAPVEVLP